MSDYENEIDVTFAVSAKIFGNHEATGAEQEEIKAKLIAAIEGHNIWISAKDVAIKVQTCTELE